ncbi:MAG: hypothetical protein V3R82_00280 [Candidatus Hydrothermarchaeales archaeon]
MAQKFLSPKQLAKKMATFRGKWYKITQKSEALNNYVSGSDAGFKKAIQSILADLEKSKTDLQDIEKQLKHTFPELRKDIDDTARKIIGEIDLFVEDVKNDMNDIIKLGELSKKLDVLDNDFKKVNTEYREFEKGSIEIATRYFDMKSDYAYKEQQIANEAKAALENIKKKFYEKAEPIVKDHRVHVGPEQVDLDTLFNMIVEGRATISKIMLIPKKKGLLGRKSQEDNKARSSVLKYVGAEILEDSAPIKKNEKRQINRLDSEFRGLKAAEKEVQEMEMKLKDLARPRDEITEQIARIKEDNAFRLLRQDEILEIRDNYISHFNQAHELVKEYLESSEKALADYEPPDPDLEKRELREKKKELSGMVKYLKEKLESAQKDLDTKTKEFEDAKESLEKNVQELKDVKADLETRLDETTSKLKEIEATRDDYKSQTENLTTIKKSLENDLKELKREKTSQEKEFNDTKADLKTRLDETNSKLKETEGIRDDFKIQTENLSATKKSLENDLKELKREKTSQEKEFTAIKNDLETRLSETTTKLKETVSVRDDYKSQTQNLTTIKKNLEAEIRTLEKDQSALETKLNKTASMLKETVSVRDEYKTRTENLTATKKSLENDVKGLEKEKSALENQLKDTEARLTTTEEQRERYKQRSNELSEGLDSLKKDMAKRLKELESSMKLKIEDIKGSKE